VKDAVLVSGNLLMARHEIEHAAQSAIEVRRGVICVERIMKGRTVWVQLFHQNAFRQWTGCFSVL
jgi:hypothetical protein